MVIKSTNTPSVCPGCRKPVQGVELSLNGVREVVLAHLCPACVLLEEDKRQAAIHRERQKRWETLCPALYRSTVACRLPQEALRTVLGWKPEEGKGLLLFGPTGRGKTRLVWLLVRRLLMEEGFFVTAMAETEFAHQCGWHFARGSAEEWVERLCLARFLFLDDLDKSVVTDRFRQELFHVIEHRMAHGRPLFLTTNLSGEDLAARLGSAMGDALLRRLREHCQTSNPNKKTKPMKEKQIQKLQERATVMDAATKLVWLDRLTAAAYMGIGTTHLDTLIKRQSLPASKLGGRVIIRRTDIDKYLDQCNPCRTWLS